MARRPISTSVMSTEVEGEGGSTHIQQLDVEDERGIRRNVVARALRAVAEIRRNRQRPLSSNAAYRRRPDPNQG